MTVLASDSFNRADSTTTLGTTDSFNGGATKTWIMYGQTGSLPTYGISTNRAYMVSNNGGFTTGSFAGMDIAQADVTFTHTLAVSAACFFVLRASVYNRYISLQMGSPIVLNTFNAGTTTQIASAGVASAAGDVFAITLNGSSITVTKNGTQIISTTSTFNQTSTIFGFSGGGSTAARFDNFQIDSLAASPTTFTASGTSDGNSTANATPVLHKQASVTSNGTSSSTANAATHLITSGTSNGTSSASASVGIVVIESSGTSDGTSTTTASPVIRKQSSGNSDGSSSANATPVQRFVASGTSVGSSWTLINLPRASGADDLYYYYSHENKKFVARN